MKPGGTGYRVLFIKRTFLPWMVIDEFYQRATCMSCDFGKQRNKITFRFGMKTLHILPDVFFLSFPRPLSPAHAHEEKYGWLARLAFPLRARFNCAGVGKSKSGPSAWDDSSREGRTRRARPVVQAWHVIF